MAICWEKAVPLAFHLCCFYFSAVLIVCVPFPFGVQGRIWNSIVSVPDRCLFIYFCYSMITKLATSVHIAHEKAGLSLTCGHTPLKAIRIFHACDVRIEKIHPRVTVWDHEDGFFYPHQTTMIQPMY